MAPSRGDERATMHLSSHHPRRGADRGDAERGRKVEVCLTCTYQIIVIRNQTRQTTEDRHERNGTASWRAVER